MERLSGVGFEAKKIRSRRGRNDDYRNQIEEASQQAASRLARLEGIQRKHLQLAKVHY
jgi:cell division protein FtsL